MSSIYIPEPCHENWAAMSPTEKGRFCAICTKEVVDFTRKTEKDILQHLEQAEGKTCGVFLPSQLSEPHMKSKPATAREFRVKKWLAASLAFLGLFNLGKEAKAQKMGKVAIKGDVMPIETHNANIQTSIIHGQVTTPDGKAVAQATVIINSGDEQIGEMKTMANGSFRTEIAPGKIKNNSISINASHDFRYKNLEQVYINKASTRVGIVLEEEYALLGEVAWVEPQEEIDTIPHAEYTTVVEESLITKVDSTFVSCSVIMGDTILVQENALPVQENVSPTLIDKVEEVIVDAAIPTEVRQPETEIVQLEHTRIYPNPGKEQLFIESDTDAVHQVTISDLQGKIIHNEQFSGMRTSFNGSTLAPGIYLIRIQTGEQSETHRWVVR